MGDFYGYYKNNTTRYATISSNSTIDGLPQKSLDFPFTLKDILCAIISKYCNTVTYKPIRTIGSFGPIGPIDPKKTEDSQYDYFEECYQEEEEVEAEPEPEEDYQENINHQTTLSDDPSSVVFNSQDDTYESLSFDLGHDINAIAFTMGSDFDTPIIEDDKYPLIHFTIVRYNNYEMVLSGFFKDMDIFWRKTFIICLS